MPPLRLCHVIHPGIVDPASDLSVAQPVTFATMETARAFAAGEAEVQMRAVLFRDEAGLALPPAFLKLPRLARSIADLKPFRRKRKLALIRDILDAGLACCDAEFVVYSNADIALQPHFYATVAALARLGHDAFVINRRTIPGTYSSPADIPLMYAEIGESHPGYDCFLFRRQAYARFKLGLLHVGSAGIGRALLANLVVCGGTFREFRDAHLTFHIGDACAWRGEEYDDYLRGNWSEFVEQLRLLEAESAPFAPWLRSYLLDTGTARHLPDFSRHCISGGRLLPAPLRLDEPAGRHGPR